MRRIIDLAIGGLDEKEFPFVQQLGSLPVQQYRLPPQTRRPTPAAL
jgi:hypothetical protein